MVGNRLVLPVLEDRIERAKAMFGEQSDAGDQATYASSGEGASREAYKDDLITIFVVLVASAPTAGLATCVTNVAQERVGLADVLADPFPKIAAEQVAPPVVLAT